MKIYTREIFYVIENRPHCRVFKYDEIFLFYFKLSMCYAYSQKIDKFFYNLYALDEILSKVYKEIKLIKTTPSYLNVITLFWLTIRSFFHGLLSMHIPS